MNCADVEILICDYLDGTLVAGQKEDVRRHLDGCPGCAELARDAQAAVSFMERSSDPEPPPELIGRILAETHSGKHGRLGRRIGVEHWFSNLFRPVLQPRMVMGMAMTIFSFAMIARLAGVPQRQLTASDLHPVAIWHALDDRAWRTWERSVKFYESLRFVYQIQTQLRDWREQQDEETGAEQPQAAAEPVDEQSSEQSPAPKR